MHQWLTFISGGAFDYDILGRVSLVEKGGMDQFTETRTYNVRSWIKSLSSGLFSETLYYNEPRTGSAIPRYDGFVSSMEWQSSGDGSVSAYDFTYDKLGRLIDARYSLLDTMSSDEYGASYSYDSQGNLLTIERRCSDGMNQGRVDRLSLTYDGNRLLKSSGTGSLSGGCSAGGAALPLEYTYDADGNMTSDPYRGVRTISYDISDHIAKLDSDSAVVSFGYLASGVKMSRKVETSSDTVLLEYVGNVVMEDGKMKYLLVDGGYIDFTSGTPVYMYYFKDHLGSNRVVASQSGSVEQVNHYYPYGLSFPLDSHTSSGSDSSGPSAGGDDQPWKYSGNELMSLGGLSVYDFNARTYDQSLGRFLSIDPLAENYYSVSPYAFCSNNPVNFVDPDGMAWYFSGTSGMFISNIDDGDDKIYIINAQQEEIFNSGNADLSKFKNTDANGNLFGQMLMDGSIEVGIALGVLGYFLEMANNIDENSSEKYLSGGLNIAFNDNNGYQAGIKPASRTLYINSERGFYNGYDIINVFSHEIKHIMDYDAKIPGSNKTTPEGEIRADEFSIDHWSFKKVSDYRKEQVFKHMKQEQNKIKKQ